MNRALMFIRYTTNTKRISSLCIYNECDYEVNRNGMHFAYQIVLGEIFNCWRITRITFIRDIHLCIMLFNCDTPFIYVKNKSGHVICKSYAHQCRLQFGAHYDLLRSLRMIDLVKN